MSAYVYTDPARRRAAAANDAAARAARAGAPPGELRELLAEARDAEEEARFWSDMEASAPALREGREWTPEEWAAAMREVRAEARAAKENSP